MFESRCGCVCSKCKFRESVGCKGCVAIENPFWGECPLKKCCEGRGLDYCGKCPEFPCGLLTEFAYDKENGDNGRRIETCRKWAAEQ